LEEREKNATGVTRERWSPRAIARKQSHKKSLQLESTTPTYLSSFSNVLFS
jgi:hypothetical protein